MLPRSCRFRQCHRLGQLAVRRSFRSLNLPLVFRARIASPRSIANRRPTLFFAYEPAMSRCRGCRKSLRRHRKGPGKRGNTRTEFLNCEFVSLRFPPLLKTSIGTLLYSHTILNESDYTVHSERPQPKRIKSTLSKPKRSSRLSYLPILIMRALRTLSAVRASRRWRRGQQLGQRSRSGGRQQMPEVIATTNQSSQARAHAFSGRIGPIE